MFIVADLVSLKGSICAVFTLSYSYGITKKDANNKILRRKLDWSASLPLLLLLMDMNNERSHTID